MTVAGSSLIKYPKNEFHGEPNAVRNLDGGIFNPEPRNFSEPKKSKI